jgi:general secretion pathway protein D
MTGQAQDARPAGAWLRCDDRRKVATRHGLWRVQVALVALLAGCAGHRAAVPPSQGHLTSEAVAPTEDTERILQPVISTPFVPPPKPRVKPATYSVVVHEVPVKELLLALARDTKENIDIHPGLQGLVSLNAIDETLPAILDRVAKQVNMRYRVEGKTIMVQPDTPYLKTYQVNYVNMTRDTNSTISVSGQIGSTSGPTGGGSQQGGQSSTSVTTRSQTNFWDLLRANIESILSSTRKLSQTAEERQARAERARAEREERLAQAEAVARAGANATNLFQTVFGPESASPSLATDIKQDVVVNQIAGTVTVMATERQHNLIQQYLDGVKTASQRQVLIEATIAEVQLSNTYQAGVDWSRFAISGSGFSFDQQMLAGVLGTAPKFVIGYTNPTSALGNITASIKLLETFGNTRVLSSPKLMALNNQTALLKVVDNVVYFQINSQIAQGTTTSSNLQSVTTTAQSVAVGVVLSLTPQITDSGVVTLTVRPTISRISGFKPDPNPALRFDITGKPLPTPLTNDVPEIQVREMESVLQLVSGQTAILGGLMQDNSQRNRNQVPGAGDLPRVGDVFAFRDEKVTKSELVIFIRPIVVNNPSIDSDELKHLRKLLPELDQTGQNP